MNPEEKKTELQARRDSYLAQRTARQQLTKEKKVGRLMSASKLFSAEASAKSKISNVSAFLMLAVALLYDLVQIASEWIGIGLVVGWVITIWAGLHFYFWMKIKGVSYVSPRRIVPFAIAFIIDIIPGTDASIILAFTWIVGIFVIVLMLRMEEVMGIKVKLKPAG